MYLLCSIILLNNNVNGKVSLLLFFSKSVFIWREMLSSTCEVLDGVCLVCGIYFYLLWQLIHCLYCDYNLLISGGES